MIMITTTVVFTDFTFVAIVSLASAVVSVVRNYCRYFDFAHLGLTIFAEKTISVIASSD